MRILLPILYLFVFSCDDDSPKMELINGPTTYDCDAGFSHIIGYSDYWNNVCYSDYDIQVLEDFISNSSATINYDIELNDNGTIEWYELGHQEWENGRLIVFNSYFNYVDNSDIYYDSQLSGDIPESIINWQYIKELRLGMGLFDGMLTGGIDILGNLTTLENLSIQNNNFDSVEIPESIYNLTNLKVLYLGRNSFIGEISSNISNLLNLEWFWVGDNNLSGNLPNEIWNIPNLYEISVENNNFTGIIPDFQEGQLINLNYLNLQNNNFESFIPESICLLEDLISLLSETYQWTSLGETWYYFNIENNNFCPDPITLDYPTCIADYIGTQNTENCEEVGLYNNNFVYPNNLPRNNIKDINKPLK